jgi:hypothetical protein
MHRSFDPEVMRKAVEPYPELIEPTYDFEGFVGNRGNVILVEGEDVGIAVQEYPGVYTGHFFLKSGGRKALDLVREMMKTMIKEYGCRCFRGITPIDKKAARWFNRKLGFHSHGIVETERGPHELFLLTAEEFIQKDKENNGSF